MVLQGVIRQKAVFLPTLTMTACKLIPNKFDV